MISVFYIFIYSLHATNELQDVVLVMGYNNTRSDDVAKIRYILSEDFKSKTVLCIEHPQPVAFQVADNVIDVSLDPNFSNLNTVLKFCEDNSYRILGVLPFSDKGTQLGSIITRHLNLPGQNPNLVRGGLDKHFFRKLEQDPIFKPKNYVPIKSRIVTKKDDIRSAYDEFSGNVFVKPCAEGNSRGCTVVDSESDIDRAWEVVSPYSINGGIVAEERVGNNFCEFSVDAVGSTLWITQKQNSSGSYRWESSYILPAPLDNLTTHQIMEAGRYMAVVCGGYGGAFHNEIFYNPTSREIRAVEPNLRPAGGSIWDAAKLAFRDFDPWRHWVHYAVGKSLPEVELVRDYYVGFQMLSAKQAGILQSLPSYKLEEDNLVGKISWNKKIGDALTNNPTNNADCIGYFLVRAPEVLDLEKVMAYVSSRLYQELIIN